MKRIPSLLCALALLTGTALRPSQAKAQRLNIHCGTVTYVTSATAAGQMTFSADGSLLVLPETSLAVNLIDSITTDHEVYEPLQVSVTYADTRTRLVVPCHLADQLTISANDGQVTCLQAPELQEEVTYRLSGQSPNGSFTTDGEYKATLVLDNLTLTNPQGAAINVENGKRIQVILPEGTTTSLADGENGAQKACFFVNGHPEFSGSGTLNLAGNSKHAFASDEYTLFKADFGTLHITKAVTDGIHVGQYLKSKGGNIHISGTGGDGIDVSVTKDPLDEMNGQILIEDGNFTLDVTSNDTKGMKCDSMMTVTGGTIHATVSGLGTKGISTGTDLMVSQTGTAPTLIQMEVTGTTYMPGDAELESKCRGIKVKGDFTFDGGTINISATGVKSKAVSVDGDYHYKSGSINCAVDAANM